MKVDREIGTRRVDASSANRRCMFGDRSMKTHRGLVREVGKRASFVLGARGVVRDCWPTDLVKRRVIPAKIASGRDLLVAVVSRTVVKAVLFRYGPICYCELWETERHP